MMFKELQVLSDQLGYHFDALLRTTEGYVVVIVDTMGSELNFIGTSPEDAIEKAHDRMACLVNQVRG